MAQLKELSNHLTVNHADQTRPSIAELELDDKSDRYEDEGPSETNCCSSRPEKSRECYLIFSVLILLVLVVLLSAGLVINYNRLKASKAILKGNFTKKPIFCKPKAKTEVCLTDGCVKAAFHIIEKANFSINPCEDFYEFACGRFVDHTKIPDDKSGVTMFSKAQDTLKMKLRIVIEDKNSDMDSNATIKAKELYASCMDLDRIEQKGLQPLYDILKFLGGWPVIEGDDWDAENFTWIDVLLKKRKLGFSINSVFIFDVDVNIENSTQRMIWLDQPILTLPREYFLKGINESDVEVFLEYTTNLAILLGANETTAKEEMTEVLEFLIHMSTNSMPREERRNIRHIHNVMNLKELNELSPVFNWIEIINKFLPDSIEVNESELVNVGDVHYFGNLTDLMEKTPKRVVANYLMMRVVIQAASFLSKDIRELAFNFLRNFSGRTTHLPRWEECVAMISRSLSYAVSNLYIKHYFQEGSKGEVEILVAYLRNNFDDMLKDLDWMDEETKKQALKKERAINSYIGYPEELLHDENISEYYSNITIGKDLLENNLGIAVYHSDYYYSKLREPIDKFDWRERGTVTQVNAFYNTAKNSIELPAGILQGAFFQVDRPRYLNFGGIGFVIGHEITHGFDDQGKQYDMDGNLHDWWQPETEKRFEEKTNCIIEQYGNYTSESSKINVNGIYTQGENIADNGGIRVAYKAYTKWVEDNGEESILPGLKYTPMQLFWIASAQIWCSVYRPELLRNKIISDNHSPENFRVNGPLSNFDKFSNDWSCDANSKMNPKNKCIVW